MNYCVISTKLNNINLINFLSMYSSILFFCINLYNVFILIDRYACIIFLDSKSMFRYNELHAFLNFGLYLSSYALCKIATHYCAKFNIFKYFCNFYNFYFLFKFSHQLLIRMLIILL